MAKKLERWVVKAGSNMICAGGPMLIRAWMQQVAQLRKRHGIEVIWVTSGAISTASDFMHGRPGFKPGKKTLAEKQALSAMGQPMVLELYALGLQAQGLASAQVLLTYDDLADTTRRANFQNTIETLLKWGVTPVLNENDAVATQEIRFGDNDMLSARVAREMKADRLVILTDVEGLYDGDPRKDPKVRLITEMVGVKPSLIKSLTAASGMTAGSERGTGGIVSKLMAARIAVSRGIETTLAKGDVPNVLLEIAAGRSVGTRVLAKRKKNTKKKAR